MGGVPRLGAATAAPGRRGGASRDGSRLGVRGAAPEDFYGFWAIFKQKWHTTRPTAPRWKALIETCQKTTLKGMRMLCRLRAREWARGRVMLRGVELGLGLVLGLELGLGLELSLIHI